jgi:hypothetical protein
MHTGINTQEIAAEIFTHPMITPLIRAPSFHDVSASLEVNKSFKLEKPTNHRNNQALVFLLKESD